MVPVAEGTRRTPAGDTTRTLLGNREHLLAADGVVADYTCTYTQHTGQHAPFWFRVTKFNVPPLQQLKVYGYMITSQ